MVRFSRTRRKNMSSHIARIEIYPEYNDDNSINIHTFSYGCLELDLMGYTDINDLIFDIKQILKNKYG